ncbi:MAG: N-acetyltransferase [Pirellulales bacterium]|nr:N-acetyltransferase [Pirellulales bacterium]
MNVEARIAKTEDLAGILGVVRQAFGRADEADLVAALVAAGDARLSLVAADGEQVVGHVLFSDMAIVGDKWTTPALALAPLAVLPARQYQGIGSLLVRRGLELVREAGHRIVLVLGHAEYYPRFGFSTSAAAAIETPFDPAHFMGLELTPGALHGVAGRVRYAAAFGVE